MPRVPLAVLALLGAACARTAAPAPTPAPTQAREAVRDAGSLAAAARARNDGWTTLRAEVRLTFEVHEPSGRVERRQARAMLAAQRPDRLRLRAHEGERPLFDLLWLGGRPQLLRGLPEADRAGALRQVLGFVFEGLRLLYRLDEGSRPDAMSEGAELGAGLRRVYRLRERRADGHLLRSTIDRETLLRGEIEELDGGGVVRGAVLSAHRRAGPIELPWQAVLVDERHAFALTVEVLDAAADEPLAASTWVP